MAFLGRCYGCRVDDHEKHTQLFDTPPPDSRLIGGGHCVCFECEPELGHLDSQNHDRKPTVAPKIDYEGYE